MSTFDLALLPPNASRVAEFEDDDSVHDVARDKPRTSAAGPLTTVKVEEVKHRSLEMTEAEAIAWISASQQIPLPTVNATFPSVNDFRIAVMASLLPSHLTATIGPHSTRSDGTVSLTMFCGQKSKGCMFRVAGEELAPGGEFVVNERLTTHNHEEGDHGTDSDGAAVAVGPSGGRSAGLRVEYRERSYEDDTLSEDEEQGRGENSHSKIYSGFSNSITPTLSPLDILDTLRCLTKVEPESNYKVTWSTKGRLAMQTYIISCLGGKPATKGYKGCGFTRRARKDAGKSEYEDIGKELKKHLESGECRSQKGKEKLVESRRARESDEEPEPRPTKKQRRDAFGQLSSNQPPLHVSPAPSPPPFRPLSPPTPSPALIALFHAIAPPSQLHTYGAQFASVGMSSSHSLVNLFMIQKEDRKWVGNGLVNAGVPRFQVMLLESGVKRRSGGLLPQPVALERARELNKTHPVPIPDLNATFPSADSFRIAVLAALLQSGLSANIRKIRLVTGGTLSIAMGCKKYSSGCRFRVVGEEVEPGGAVKVVRRQVEHVHDGSTKRVEEDATGREGPKAGAAALLAEVEAQSEHDTDSSAAASEDDVSASGSVKPVESTTSPDELLNDLRRLTGYSPIEHYRVTWSWRGKRSPSSYTVSCLGRPPSPNGNQACGFSRKVKKERTSASEIESVAKELKDHLEARACGPVKDDDGRLEREDRVTTTANNGGGKRRSNSVEGDQPRKKLKSAAELELAATHLAPTPPALVALLHALAPRSQLHTYATIFPSIGLTTLESFMNLLVMGEEQRLSVVTELEKAGVPSVEAMRLESGVTRVKEECEIEQRWK
ncbi:hypothetical protein MNV49_003403 [Pseudohyphozyma bogoriensis]|nr:hypothetical protein MNV49_003403 [Pseudohyphozyma bogoriensis]